MLCDICHKNEANIVFQVFQNGRMTTHPVCAECAMKAQKEFLRALEMLGGGAQRQAAAEKPADMPRRLCPHCGTAVDQINESTVLGCPRCYEAAERQVGALLQGTQAVQEKKNSVSENMAHRLREALASEDYEQAARLRDMIRDAGDRQEG